VLDDHLLLAPGPVALERLDLGSECAAKLVVEPPEVLNMIQPLGICQAPSLSHHHTMGDRHLRREQRLDLVLRLDPMNEGHREVHRRGILLLADIERIHETVDIADQEIVVCRWAGARSSGGTEAVGTAPERAMVGAPRQALGSPSAQAIEQSCGSTWSLPLTKLGSILSIGMLDQSPGVIRRNFPRACSI